MERILKGQQGSASNVPDEILNLYPFWIKLNLIKGLMNIIYYIEFQRQKS